MSRSGLGCGGGSSGLQGGEDGVPEGVGLLEEGQDDDVVVLDDGGDAVGEVCGGSGDGDGGGLLG